MSKHESKDTWNMDMPDIRHLEKLIQDKHVTVYDSDCIRKKSNWSKSNNAFKFDSLGFDPKLLLKELEYRSPKLEKLLDTISKLDEKDQKESGRTFKHFIFSDLKSGSHGSKIIASAFLAKGMTLGYEASVLNKQTKTKPSAPVPVPVPAEEATPVPEEEEEATPVPEEEAAPVPAEEEATPVPEEEEEATPVPAEAEAEAEATPVPEEEEETVPTGGKKSNTDEEKESKEKTKYGKIRLLSDEELLKTRGNNFYLLSSTTVYDQPISVATKKSILKKYNERPDNVYGDLARFIILDSGFKEGIDLFDVKYVHIFEPQITPSDRKQVIGRATRTCGQKGLVFHPTQGWTLHVFHYDIVFNTEFQKSFDHVRTAFEYYLKATHIDLRLLHLTDEMERLAILGSVDYELNRNIHEFSVAKGEAKQGVKGGSKNFKFIIRDDSIPILIDFKAKGGPHFSEINHENMKRYIHDNFAQYSWDKVKMENNCGYAGPAVTGGADLMTFTPTQDFIRHYFTPQNPLKGMLLYQSVGTGKTCTAIATASSTFEKQGYTILWVTRTTLKNDIWKNMFEQSCSEILREAIARGEKIPEEQIKRMQMLSKSWKIRPLSYKQFSNLVSKQNQYYKELVQINGEADPLRKTLVIIDEAHKLYGGSDLSTLEKPDMEAFHKALMNSYLVSGVDSVKLLLMTATPITTDPFELVKMMNLCKLPVQQIATDYDTFSKNYLDETGHFTEKGSQHFLDQIAGHISYLNREKDARQFSQPILMNVEVPLVKEKNVEFIQQYDKYVVKEMADEKIRVLQDSLDNQTREFENDWKKIDADRFQYLNKKCDDLDDPKKCHSIVKKNIQEIVQEAKTEASQFKQRIKTIQKQLKIDVKSKNDELKKIRVRMEKNPQEYEKYKNSTYYNLKFNCSKTVKQPGDIDEILQEHPAIVETDKILDELNMKKKDMEDNYHLTVESYKNKIKSTQENLKKQDLSIVDKNIAKVTVETLKTDFQQTQKQNKQIMRENLKQIHNQTKKIHKKRGEIIKGLRKSIQKTLKDKKKKQKENQKEEKKLQTILMEQGEMKNEWMKNLVSKHSDKIDQQITQLKKENTAAAWNKIQEDRQKQEKEKEKAILKKNKEEEKERNAKKKEMIRQTKKKERETTKAEKEQIRAENKIRKEAIRKTRKLRVKK